MPRTRPLDSYPNAEFWALVQRARHEPFLVPCTRPQAASMRGEIYAWRRAVERDPADAASFGIDAAVLRGMAWKITDQGLITMPHTQLQAPSLIAAALGGPVPPLRSAAEVSLERLRALGQGEPDDGP